MIMMVFVINQKKAVNNNLFGNVKVIHKYNVSFSLLTDCNQANEANLSVRHQTLAVRPVFMLPDYGRVNLHCNHPGKHYWLLLSDYEKMAN